MVGTIDYIWRDDVKKAKDTPEGFTYVGKSGKDIIRNLGFVGFEQTMETTSESPIAEDLGINWFACFWTKMKSTSNLLVTANISTGGTSTETNKHGIQFEGIVISAFVSTETFQRSGDFNSLGRLSVSYNGKLREELLTDASSTSIYPTNSIPTSARIQIPKKEMTYGMRINTTIFGSWEIVKPGGRCIVGTYGTWPYSYIHKREL